MSMRHCLRDTLLLLMFMWNFRFNGPLWDLPAGNHGSCIHHLRLDILFWWTKLASFLVGASHRENWPFSELYISSLCSGRSTSFTLRVWLHKCNTAAKLCYDYKFQRIFRKLAKRNTKNSNELFRIWSKFIGSLPKMIYEYDKKTPENYLSLSGGFWRLRYECLSIPNYSRNQIH